MHFYMVDVFAETRYSGNQLAVFCDSGNLSDSEMQTIAREVNFSETTFIKGICEDGSYAVRIYTPEYEVPFAGHPTLGTAYIIRNKLMTEPQDQVTLSLEAGKIPVTRLGGGDADIYFMKQLAPEFRNILAVEDLAPVLGLSPDDFDRRFPIQEVSTGLAHIIVPIRSLEALRRVKVSRDLYFDLIGRTWAKNIQVFCPEGHGEGKAISTRMFTDYLGIPEDPATGSGNGCLAGYLVKHRFFGSSEIDIRSEQGYEMGRPSVLYLKAGSQENTIQVQVGGKVVPIAEGDFL